MKVLLWKIGALGDVVMTTPLLRQLRARLPDAQIDYLVGRGVRVVLDGNPHLSRVLEFDERILFGGQVSRLGEILEKLRGYDAVYVLDKHWVFTLLAWLARVPRRIGFRRRAAEGLFLTHTVRYGEVAHEVDYYLRLLAASGLEVDASDRRLELPPATAYPLARPYTVLVNSGGRNANEQSSVRQLPVDLFRALALRVAREQQVVFVGSAPERAYYDALRVPDAINLCGSISLPQVWGVLQGATRVYSTDCGLMHMAGALNANVTGIFGPTHPRRKCPPGARSVWSDEARYDAAYELFGRIPRGHHYFGELTVDALSENACHE
ncbi:glycosyltransferase family 9 protein [Ramlibacter sp. G-1-2-2]|uniref:Glycosyltransferase family 9 protein n=1 Tax=Ramlibacter agri TaxID=2728837 RepID=A0A848GZA0_9BURK|nr:glycosyltransferase family 9 protein [Ramlibacter agri]NML42711.1 glycosyltransferase family 9 protein [Ramlibacter agri]